MKYCSLLTIEMSQQGSVTKEIHLIPLTPTKRWLDVAIVVDNKGQIF